jgi:hypothetical protein
VTPNPAGRFIHLAGTGLPEGPLEIMLMDLNGHQLQRASLSSKNDPIDTGNLAPGLYFIGVMTAGRESHFSKFLVE